MAPRYSSRTVPRFDRSGLSRRRFGGLDHARPRPQLVLTVDDDALALRQTGLDQGLALPPRGDAHRPYLDRAVRPDDKGEAAVGAGLHRGGRHHRAMPSPEPEPGIDKGTRPQPLVIVRKHRLQPGRAGALLDLVVDQFKPPGAETDPVVLVPGQHPERSLVQRFGDLRQVLLRQRLRNDDETRRVGGVDNVALVNQPDAGAAG